MRYQTLDVNEFFSNKFHCHRILNRGNIGCEERSFVSIFKIQTPLKLAHQSHFSSFPNHEGRLLHRQRFSSRLNHNVRTSFSDFLDPLNSFFLCRVDAEFSAVLLGKLKPVILQIHSDNPATFEPGNLRHQQANWSLTDYGRPIANIRLKQIHHVQRKPNRLNYASLLIAYVFGHGNKIFRTNGYGLGEKSVLVDAHELT